MNRSTLALTACILVSISLIGEEPTDKLQSQVARVQAFQKKEIGRLKSERADLAKSKKGDRKSFREIDMRIKTLEGGGIPDIELDPRKLQVGQIGRLGVIRLEVIQVIGPDKLLAIPVSTKMDIVPATKGDRETGGLTQEFTEERGKPIMIRMSTKALADGQTIDSKQSFDVVATESYRTAGGSSSTVFVVEPVDLAAVAKQLKKPTRSK